MPRGVYIRTPEYRQKQRLAMFRHENPGRNKSEETKRKIGDAQRGKPKSEVFKEKCRQRMKGTAFFKGRKHSPAFSQLMSKVHSGSNHHNWKGGITPIIHLIRSSGEYINWRNAVRRRDDFTCQICHKRGGDLHVDHIKPFADFPELRFDIANGRTLCVACHKQTPTYGGKYRVWKRTA